jgi:hypothetical protein
MGRYLKAMDQYRKITTRHRGMNLRKTYAAKQMLLTDLTHLT